MKEENFKQFLQQVRSLIPSDRLILDPARRLAYGTDASFYRLIPQLVVKVKNESEIVFLLRTAANFTVPVTFRAAGTSLSGQALTDSVLITLDTEWTHFKILDQGKKIALQPGITGAQANRYLAPYQRKIGPDPASIDSAKIGGIAANNASGMCCGTAQNSYQTLDSMKLILADGTSLDTADEVSRRNFVNSHTALLAGLRQLHEEVKQDTTLTERIRHKYKIKNTTGYSLNALIDFHDPFDILQHLMIGSEGTLAFMAEVTYRTVPDFTNKASALLLYQDIKHACLAVQQLKKAPVAAAELMDRSSLRSMEQRKDLGFALAELPDGAAAILVETRAESAAKLTQQILTIKKTLSTIPILYPVEFTAEAAEYTKLWDIRKGLFPTVGAMRETGTTVIIEDIAFPIESLAEATLQLQALFKQHGYHDAIIFGHALEGNLHFVFPQSFQSPTEIKRYEQFMDDVCRMVVEQYDGSLKAEHGTGRNMAPFVEKEWGPAAYQLMQRIKKILDPQGILNPDVILSTDKKLHIKNLKPMPEANPLVDKCIECGFCEINCPSRDLTFTPRQRIVLWREISHLQREGNDPDRLKELERAFSYYGESTCATDGLCATSCPVNIDTGKLIKEIRQEQKTTQQNDKANWVGENFDKITRWTGYSLGFANQIHRILGTRGMKGLTGLTRKLSGNRIPRWTPTMPRPANFKQEKVIQVKSKKKVVYFPSCLARTMGPAQSSPEQENLPDTIITVLNRAGYEAIIPESLDKLCCGKAFESKGYQPTAQKKQEELNQVLLQASQDGKYPVLCETSPCLKHMKETLSPQLSLYEPLEFAENFLLENLTFKQQEAPITVHLTCSAKKMGLDKALSKVAQYCAKEVIQPDKVGCCGFAGDKGFFYPELNRSALQDLKQQIPADCQDGYSTSSTCEIGLSEHGQIPYRSIFYLLEKTTR